MDQPVSKASSNTTMRPASGAVMDRVVPPSRRKVVLRKTLRYGAPVVVIGLL